MVNLLVLVFLFITALFGLDEAVVGLKPTLLVLILMISLLTNWILARSQIPGIIAGIIMLAVGLCVITIVAGNLAGKIEQAIQAASKTGWVYLLGIFQNNPNTDTTLLETLTADLVANLTRFFRHVAMWSQAQVSGKPFFNQAAVIFVWSCLLYACAAWAVWFTARRSKPLIALLPISIILAATISFAKLDPSLILVYLGASLLLIITSSHNKLKGHWQRKGIDYPDDLGIDIGVTTAIILFITVIIAFTVMIIPVEKALNFARGLTQQYGLEESQFSESLGIRQRVPEEGLGIVGLHGAYGGLPRNHLLGAGPELSKELVMMVRITNGVPLPDDPHLDTSSAHYYWKQVSFDEYTGQGWLIGDYEQEIHPVGENLLDVIPPFTQLVEQEIQLMENRGNAVSQAGILFSIDKEIEVSWMKFDDLNVKEMVGAVFSGDQGSGGKSYTATSLVNVAGESDLRKSGEGYPDWVVENYLDLPGAIPERVFNLAEKLTAGISTKYDKALAIESYLREYPYTLELAEPPGDRDVVDYFLFEEKKGYCDYYASAMVVLARAAGIPARMVIGYGSGSYDGINNQFIVTEANAHSWVEIFFPDIGWVTFEPTAGRPPLERLENEPQSDISTITQTTKQKSLSPLANIELLLIPIVGISIFVLVITGWSLVEAIWLYQTEPSSSITTIFERMHKRGNRILTGPQAARTPHEFAGSLSDAVSSRTIGSRFNRAFVSASQEITSITNLYAKVVYSPNLPSARDRNLAIRNWLPLRWRLRLVRHLRLTAKQDVKEYLYNKSKG